jgi:hypothetical protein
MRVSLYIHPAGWRRNAIFEGLQELQLKWRLRSPTDSGAGSVGFSEIVVRYRVVIGHWCSPVASGVNRGMPFENHYGTYNTEAATVKKKQAR